MWVTVAEEAGLETRPGASKEEIAAAESALGQTLPDGLRDLLLESNGLYDPAAYLYVVDPLADIVTTNRDMRKTEAFADLYMPFDALLFFGSAGNGDLFALAICNGVVRERDVFVWDHEDDSRMTTSASLERYVRGERWHERR
jgi:SUKH superfamily protein